MCVCVCVCEKSEYSEGSVPELAAALDAASPALGSFGLLAGDAAALTVATTAAIIRGDVNLFLADAAEDGVTGVVADDDRTGFSFKSVATTCKALVNSKNDGSG